MREKALVEEILKEAISWRRDFKGIYKLALTVVAAIAVISFGLQWAFSPINTDDQRLIRAIAADISRMDGTDVRDELEHAAAVAGRATYRDIRVIELSDVLAYMRGRVAATERRRVHAGLDDDIPPTTMTQ